MYSKCASLYKTDYAFEYTKKKLLEFSLNNKKKSAGKAKFFEKPNFFVNKTISEQFQFKIEIV